MTVHEQSALFLHLIHEQFRTLPRLDLVAGRKLHAAQRRGLGRVLPLLARRGKEHLHTTETRLQNNPETKLRFGVADPSLSGDWCALVLAHEKGREG